jgi:hypothetical protein
MAQTVSWCELQGEKMEKYFRDSGLDLGPLGIRNTLL